MGARFLLILLCSLVMVATPDLLRADKHPMRENVCCCPKPHCPKEKEPCPYPTFTWIVCHPKCKPHVRPCAPVCEDCSAKRENDCCEGLHRAVVCPPHVEICPPQCCKCHPTCRWGNRYKCCYREIRDHKCKICRPKFVLKYSCCDEGPLPVEGVPFPG